MAVAKMLQRDRLGLRGGELAQIYFFAGPARPHRGQGRDQARMRIESALRIGMPSLHAARMEKKIVKVPQHEIAIPFRRAQRIHALGLELEKDLTIQQQAAKLVVRKVILPAQLSHPSRRSKQRHRARKLAIATP